MSQNLIVNGVTYTYPDTGDANWGPDATAWAVAVTQNMLQRTGGLFTVSSEVDFGSSFGLKSLYYKSRSANVASTGIVRLANNGDAIAWRNAANSADLTLYVNASNELIFNGTPVSGIVPTDTNSIDLTFTAPNLSADLRLDGATLTIGVGGVKVTDLGLADAQISATAAIAYSKLALALSIVNGDISTTAAIDLSKLAALTIDRALVSSGTGVISVSSVTATELGYLSGVTGSISTALSDRVLKAGDTMTGALHLPNGATASPALTGVDTDTGLVFGTNQINVSLNGLDYFRFGVGSLSVNQAIPFLVNGGTAAAPSLADSGGSTTGIYFPGSNVFGITTAGVSRATINATAITSTVPYYAPNGSAAAPAYSFTSDPDSGIASNGANEIIFVSGATDKWRVAASSFYPTVDNTTDIGTTGKNLRDLYVKTGILFTETGAGNDYVKVEPPSAVTTSYRLALPAAAPTQAGQVLKVLATGTPNTLEWGLGGGGSFEYVSYVVGTASAPYTGSQTQFDLPFTYSQDGKTVQVFYNGQQLKLTTDYTETTGSQITTTSPLVIGGSIWFRSVSNPTAPSTVTLYREDYIVGTPSGNYLGGTTQFDLVNSYNVGGNAMLVTLDGDVQTKGASADYLESSSTRVTFNNALVNGQRVSFIWSQTVGGTGVNSGTSGQLAYYAATGGVVSGSSILNQTAYGLGVGSGNPSSAGFLADFRYDAAATTAYMRLVNNQASSDSFAGMSFVTNASGGDPFIAFATQDVASWGAGVDNSDSDKLKIYHNTASPSNIHNPSDGTNVNDIIIDTTSGVAIKGTTTNDSASAGYVGEYVVATSQTDSPAATATWYDVCSISLTAGDWDVSAIRITGRNANSQLSQSYLGISTTSGNSATGLVPGDNEVYRNIDGTVGSGLTDGTLTIPSYRMSLSSTTTVYMKGYDQWGGVTGPHVYARLSARRVR